MIRRIAVSDPTSSASFIRSNLPINKQPSTRTIRRRLQVDYKLRAYRPACVPRLSAKNIKDRLKFAQKYKDWSQQQWEDVMFSDETTVKQYYAFSSHVRRPVGQRHKARYTLPRVKQSESIMVWGCISGHGRGGLWFLPPGKIINAATYNKILKDKLILFMNMHKTKYFQQDNAPAHTAKSVKE